ncbi:CDP-alcohol phosphatidyltransferase family protein [Longispora sp. K20-0274]|uniref:CDP-alcohol phosphatidyltransferase family protein n=1 Tax=Longispora sp. K20-0274 TaxID=3088255 RepID=UPI00399A3357
MGVVELTTLGWDGYAARWASLHGVDPRTTPQPFRGWLRVSYALARPFARFGATPGTLLAASLVLSLAVPALTVFGGGATLVAAVAVLFAVVADAVSRALAVLTERITRLGYVYAALVERLSEAAWLVGLWLLGAPGVLVVACGAATWFQEYLRSRTAETGAVLVTGSILGERGPRIAVAVAGLVLCGLAGAASDTLARGAAALVAAVWLLVAVLGLTHVFGTVRRDLG